IAANAGSAPAAVSALVTGALRSFHAPGAIAFEVPECRGIQLTLLRQRLTGPFSPCGVSFFLTGVIIQKTFSCGWGALRLLHRIPITVAPLAPIAILIAPVSVSVSTCINVVALFTDEALTAAIDHSALLA